MAYDSNDPRSKLSTAVQGPAGVPRPATYRAFDDLPPDEELPNGSHTWWTRTQALVVAHTFAQTGDVLPASSDGEYGVIVADGAQVTVEHGTESADVNEYAAVIMPSGDSTVTVTAPGQIVRIFGAPTVPELAAKCANANDFETPDLNVAEWAPWPNSPNGEKIRVYLASDYPLVEGRMGRLFRSTTVMINLFDPPDLSGRDMNIVSPHHHADHEQVQISQWALALDSRRR